jgi:hypothetical protein
MSKYTTELRYICESLAGMDESMGYNSVADIIEEARPKLFNFNYPIFDSTHKEELETKIIKHYYTQEIGLETYGLWHLELDKRMNEIMPYYNQLYESASLEFNPLDDVNYTKTHEGSHSENETEGTENVDNSRNTRTVNSTEQSSRNETDTTSTSSTSKYSDTPQGTIANVDVTENAYLTNVTKDDGSGTDTVQASGTRTVNSSDTNVYSDTRNIDRSKDNTGENEYTETMHGKVGTYSYAKLLKDYRDQILNIDMMIINDLQDLFMLLW